jgi:serine/threonine protein kinase
MSSNEGDDGIDAIDIPKTRYVLIERDPNAPKISVGDTLFGRYICRGKLGEGGMGCVYLVYDLITRELFALKLIVPLNDSPEARSRFRREIAIQRRFIHQNIVNVHDFGIPSGDRIGFIAMEYIGGPNLEEQIRETAPLPINLVAALVEQACAALEVIHGAGILHRDIKPNNIFVTSRPGGRPLFMLGDFGIAKDLIEPDTSFRTESNAIVGTPLYLAPEIFYGCEPSRQSDLYALAIVVTRAATGMPPRDVIAWAAKTCPSPLPGLPHETSAMLLRALSISPTRRPETAGDFAREFLSTIRVAPGKPPKAGRSWFKSILSFF